MAIKGTPWGDSRDKVGSEQNVMQEEKQQALYQASQSGVPPDQVSVNRNGARTLSETLATYWEHTNTLLQGLGTLEDFSRDHHGKYFKYTV